ncbi:hypothetical protein EHQ12_14490 [Leptospira gomenensis]|uniref:Uncharacterized protein n=1 Tax=Leptospira gomenensis TaxID=2484974 RepID=A0A5F1YAT1_9LEPT|nr:hypothetical protein [Leptospira gomenensis]TGK33880.1 hypothetical protein EHQ17_10290 [Leptospira gomenensis]TGK36335.1 hypothetical protein EHQ12_14490 [Leptospira gomenensis]TGK52105.1 hypothetical protein EHQ07_00585 [Leptospira gomenensis]TGK59846.1 hypothetical protein EHQ13_11470 [Leptospira gomenensis]
MFFIAQARPVLMWPEFSWIPVINGVIFVALLLLAGYWLERRFRHSTQLKAALYARILKKLPLAYLQGRDVVHIHSFLEHASVSTLKRIAESPVWFQEFFLPEFASYLAHQGELPAWRDALIFRRLSHLVHDLGPHPKKILPVVFLTDAEEAFPGFLYSGTLGPEFVQKSLHAKLFTKKLYHSFPTEPGEKIHVLYSGEEKDWIRFDATVLNFDGNDISIQILSAPEKDVEKTRVWGGIQMGDVTSQEETVLPEEFRDSLSQIVKYSGVDSFTASEIQKRVRAFQEHPGFVRKEHKPEEIQTFIRLYSACYAKYRSDISSIPKPVLLFLYFFYLDEHLLSPTRIVQLDSTLQKLRNHKAETSPSQHSLAVYFLPEWLGLILAGNKNPSRNHLAQSYEQVKASLVRKTGKDESANQSGIEDLLHLLDWELSNLLYNGLIGVSSNPNLAYPILSEDQMYGETDAFLVTPEKLNAVVDHVRKIDKHLFYRQIVFEPESTPGKQELAMKEVFPDCIILPVFGSRGVLWQEISSGVFSRGRLVFPQILNENATLAITRTLGEFRWEMERTVRGRKWKDSSPPSLTSEYFLYLENYRKSPALTPDAKKTIDQQMMKYKKNLKDMFASDYSYWVLFESSGKTRLNRVVRDILNRYAPFAPSIREELRKHPIFKEFMETFEARKRRLVSGIKKRYNPYFQAGNVPVEVSETIQLFEEM